jgi:hypothetical protein
MNRKLNKAEESIRNQMEILSNYIFKIVLTVGTQINELDETQNNNNSKSHTDIPIIEENTKTVKEEDDCETK